MRLARFVTALALTFSCSFDANAHVELAKRTALPGSAFQAVFNVGHGCAGAATTAIHIRLDDRIVSATPVAQSGWKLEVATAAVKQADGTQRDVPREISWTGGQLDAKAKGQFSMTVQLPPAPSGTAIYFPVVQECGSAVVRWIETPLKDEKPEALGEPAPFVTLTNEPAPDTAR